MFGKSSVKKLVVNNVFMDYLKGIIIALLISMALIFAFAFSLKWFDISDAFIPMVTLIIKGLSVLIGAIIAIKGKEKGLLKGLLFGIIYTFLAMLIFSILSGSFDIGMSFVLDVLFAGILGGLVGIVKVNKA